MITILHGADFHLDSPFSGLSPQLAAQRRSEQRSLLARMAEVATKHHADLALLSGDLFDGDRIYRETAQQFATELGKFPCPVLIAPGNHDYFSPRSPYATLDFPENVHIFSTTSIDSVEYPSLNCTVHGAAFCDAHMETTPLRGFTAPDDGRIHLMTLHGALDGTDYAPISAEDIANSGLTYLALGHIHQTSGLQQVGRTHYAYSGCPEGRGFDELGDKGVLCITIENGAVSSEFIPIATHRHQILSIDMTGVTTPLETISTQLPDDCANDCYRIRLVGALGEGVSHDGLSELLTPHFFSLDLRDETRPATSLFARIDEDSLAGLFLQEMTARGDIQDETLLLAVRYGLSALEQGEDVAP